MLFLLLPIEELTQQAFQSPFSDWPPIQNHQRISFGLEGLEFLEFHQAFSCPGGTFDIVVGPQLRV